MANKRWPADITIDGTATATKTFGSNPNGDPVFVTRPAGGETLDTVLTRGSVSTKPITIAGVLKINRSAAAQYTQIDSEAGATTILSKSMVNATFAQMLFSQGNNATDREMARFDGSGNFGIGITAPTEKLHVTGNIKATGSVSGTVFNPTSLRNRKRDIEAYEGNALEDINALQLHTYHFREYNNVETEPGVYEEQEIAEIDQMLNVGVILDEVENPLIADQERGCLNLNNIVFLQAKAIQQLSAKLEELTQRIEALEG